MHICCGDPDLVSPERRSRVLGTGHRASWHCARISGLAGAPSSVTAEPAARTGGGPRHRWSMGPRVAAGFRRSPTGRSVRGQRLPTSRRDSGRHHESGRARLSGESPPHRVCGVDRARRRRGGFGRRHRRRAAVQPPRVARSRSDGGVGAAGSGHGDGATRRQAFVRVLTRQAWPDVRGRARAHFGWTIGSSVLVATV